MYMISESHLIYSGMGVYLVIDPKAGSTPGMKDPMMLDEPKATSSLLGDTE